MSKIENALEKASILREAVTDKPPVAHHAPVSLPIPPVAFESINVSHPLLVTASDPHTPVAEEYRKLKSIVVQLTRQEDFRNVVMVTSSLCSEGKSITALNLAITLAHEHDHTVLLIDADLRKPSLHSYLGIEPELGLSECLTQGADVGKAIIRTGIGRLSLLPAGEKVKAPVELFSSQRVKEFFLEIKNRYGDRYIIIDAPPVLPFTESRTLSTIVDAILLVVKEGVASPHEIAETIGCLGNAELLGIVFNEVTAEPRNDHNFYY